MSNDYDRHIILHHLDDPLRIFWWTIPEAMIVLLPPIIGIGINQFVLGCAVSGLGYWGLKRLKKQVGLMALKHALYWHLPHSKRTAPSSPPSYIREYLG